MDRTWRALTVLVASAALLATAVPAAVAAQSRPPVDVGMHVDVGSADPVPLADVDADDPLRLRPDRELVVRLRITNRGPEPVTVRSVRLQGRVLGMTFFRFAGAVDLRVGPGATERLQLPLDIADLGEQATGLLPAELSVLAEDRSVLARERFPVDVRGSVWSTYGMFGVLVGVVTLLLLVAALVRLALGLLPRHRWLRASRFAVPGLGLGLTLTFTLSVFAVLVPRADAWAAIVVVGGLVGLVVGFLTPTPGPRAARRLPLTGRPPLADDLAVGHAGAERTDRPDDAVADDALTDTPLEDQPLEDRPPLTIVLPDVVPSAPRPRTAEPAQRAEPGHPDASARTS